MSLHHLAASRAQPPFFDLYFTNDTSHYSASHIQDQLYNTNLLVMKSSGFLAASLLASSVAASILQPLAQQQPIQEEELYLVELAPGQTRWISEEEKWELKRVGSISVESSVLLSRLYSALFGSHHLLSARTLPYILETAIYLWRVSRPQRILGGSHESSHSKRHGYFTNTPVK